MKYTNKNFFFSRRRKCQWLILPTQVTPFHFYYIFFFLYSMNYLSQLGPKVVRIPRLNGIILYLAENFFFSILFPWSIFLLIPICIQKSQLIFEQHISLLYIKWREKKWEIYSTWLHYLIFTIFHLAMELERWMSII